MLNLLPKDTLFFDLFEKLAQHAVTVAEQLQGMSRQYEHHEVFVPRIRAEEHAADDLAHQALERLDRTFITPVDREDIHTLVGELDDIIDTIDSLAKRMPLFHIQKVEEPFQKQVDVLVAAIKEMRDAVHMLRKTRKLQDLSPRLIEIHRLESVGDDNHHAAISGLYKNSTDALHVMKWKELYEKVEDAIDGCEDVGNTLERIVLKNG